MSLGVLVARLTQLTHRLAASRYGSEPVPASPLLTPA